MIFINVEQISAKLGRSAALAFQHFIINEYLQKNKIGKATITRMK